MEYELKYDEGCPVKATIDAGEFWEGGPCPQCSATTVPEACFTLVPKAEDEDQPPQDPGWRHAGRKHRSSAR
jgi:hypothetical protein